MFDGQTELNQDSQQDEDESEGFKDIGDLWDAKVKEVTGEEYDLMVKALEEFVESQIRDINNLKLEEIKIIAERFLFSFNEAIKGYDETGNIKEDAVEQTLKKYKNQPLRAAAIEKSVIFLKKIDTIRLETQGDYFGRFDRTQKKTYVAEGIMSALQKYKAGVVDNSQRSSVPTVEPPQIEPFPLGGYSGRSGWRGR